MVSTYDQALGSLSPHALISPRCARGGGNCSVRKGPDRVSGVTVQAPSFAVRLPYTVPTVPCTFRTRLWGAWGMWAYVCASMVHACPWTPSWLEGRVPEVSRVYGWMDDVHPSLTTVLVCVGSLVCQG